MCVYIYYYIYIYNVSLNKYSLKNLQWLQGSFISHPHTWKLQPRKTEFIAVTFAGKSKIFTAGRRISFREKIIFM